MIYRVDLRIGLSIPGLIEIIMYTSAAAVLARGHLNDLSRATNWEATGSEQIESAPKLLADFCICSQGRINQSNRGLFESAWINRGKLLPVRRRMSNLCGIAPPWLK